MSDETKRLDIEAIEARAKRDVVPCDTCGAPATKECSESECRTSRCEAHAVFFDGHCTHRWWRRDDRPAETLDLVAEVRRLREIIEGRTTPPTPKEITAHAQRRGWWLLRVDHEDRRLVYTLDAGCEDALAEARGGARAGVRWWALECGGERCAWPVAP